MSLYPHAPPPRCSLLLISFYCFRKYETSSFVLPKVVVSLFPFGTSSRRISPFVSPILRGRSGGYCRSPLRCKDRPKCNSHFPRSSSPPLRPIPFPNVLADISCLLNCYLVEKMVSSPQNRTSFKRHLTNTLNNVEKFKLIKLITFFSSCLIYCLDVLVLVWLK